MTDDERVRRDEDEEQGAGAEAEASEDDSEPDFELHGQFFNAPEK